MLAIDFLNEQIKDADNSIVYYTEERNLEKLNYWTGYKNALTEMYDRFAMELQNNAIHEDFEV